MYNSVSSCQGEEVGAEKIGQGIIYILALHWAGGRCPSDAGRCVCVCARACTHLRACTRVQVNQCLPNVCTQAVWLEQGPGPHSGMTPSPFLPQTCAHRYEARQRVDQTLETRDVIGRCFVLSQDRSKPNTDSSSSSLPGMLPINSQFNYPLCHPGVCFLQKLPVSVFC